MNRLKKGISGLLIALLLLLTWGNRSLAAGTLSVSVSGGGTYNVGDSFTVTISTSAEGSYVAEGTISYDPAVLSCANVSGTIAFTSNSGSIVSTVGGASITFTCIANGSTAISVSGVSGYDVATAEDLQVAASGASVSVVTPTTAPVSSEANLTGLLTSLGQVDAAAGSWRLNCDYNTTTFAINPSVSAGATWAAGGDFNNLQVGENHFTITVTAQDGVTQNTYNITVVRANAPETQPTQPSSTEPSSEKESESETETEEETSTEAQKVLTVMYGDTTLYAVDTLEEVTIPDGFTETQQMLDDGYAAAVKNDAGLVLLYLTDENGENGAFYVYDTDTKEVYPFVTADQPQEQFIFLRIPEGEQIPEGYEAVTLTVDGKEVDALKRTDAEEELYLVYVMNEDGETGWYRYDADGGAFFRYISDGNGTDEAELAALKAEYEAEKSEYEDQLSRRFMCIVILALLFVWVVILAIVLLVLLIRTRKYLEAQTEEEDGEGEQPLYEDVFPDEDTETELMPDMEELLAKVGMGEELVETDAEDELMETGAEEEPEEDSAETLSEEPEEEEAGEMVIDFADEKEPVAEEPAGEEPTGEELSGEESIGEELAGEEPAGEEPVGEESNGEEPAGEELTGEKSEEEKIVAEGLREFEALEEDDLELLDLDDLMTSEETED